MHGNITDFKRFESDEINKLPKTAGMMVAIDRNLNTELNYLLNSGCYPSVTDLLIDKNIDPSVRAYYWIRTGMDLGTTHYLTGEVLDQVVERYLRAIRRDINSLAFDKFKEFIGVFELNECRNLIGEMLVSKPKFSDTLAILMTEVLQSGDTHKAGTLLDFMNTAGLFDIMNTHTELMKTCLFHVSYVEYRYDSEIEEFKEMIFKSDEGREFNVEEDEIFEIPNVSVSLGGDTLLKAATYDRGVFLRMSTMMLDFMHDTVMGGLVNTVDEFRLIDSFDDGTILRLGSCVGTIFDMISHFMETIRGFHLAAHSIQDILRYLRETLPPPLYTMFKEEFMARHLAYIMKVMDKYKDDTDGVFDMTAYQSLVIEQDLGNIHDHIHWYLSTKNIGGPKYYIDMNADEMFEALDDVTTELNLGSVSRTAMIDEIRNLSDFSFSDEQ